MTTIDPAHGTRDMTRERHVIGLSREYEDEHSMVSRFKADKLLARRMFNDSAPAELQRRIEADTDVPPNFDKTGIILRGMIRDLITGPTELTVN